MIMNLRTLMYLLKCLNKDIRALPMDDKRFKRKVRQARVITCKLIEIERVLHKQAIHRINYPFLKWLWL